MDFNKMEETSAHILTPHERTFILVFLTRMVCGGDPFYLQFWAKLNLVQRKR